MHRPAVLVFLLLAVACGGDSDDSRLGEEGRLRFTGGGCTGSTTLAVGGRINLRLESATEEPLPGELGVTSGAPDVISAHMGLDPSTVDLEAHREGSSRIEITEHGDELDALEFSAAPAGLVKHGGVDRAFAGAGADVVVNDVFGDCGEDDACRLLGSGFLDWRVEPEEAGAFVLENEGVAAFRMLVAGDGSLIGQERSRGRDLVSRTIEVVAIDQAADLAATLTTISFDPEVTGSDVALPGSAKRLDAFSLRLDGVLTDDSRVPIARRDVVWRIEGEELAIPAPSSDERDPLATVFLSGRTGTMTLVASVAVLALERSFEVELTE